MKTLAWTGKSGNHIELRAECRTYMSVVTRDLDGDVFEAGKEPFTMANLELWVDGKLIDRCHDINYWQIMDAPGGIKVIRGLKVGMVPEQAVIVEKFLQDIIEEGIEDEVKEYKAQKAAEEKAERIAKAKEIIAQASTYTQPLMTRAEYRKWRKWYNNLHNEGGDGYIPYRVTVEEYEWAQKVLAEQ
jgi:hypothetical protein